jgi:sigma-54 dependent transcriptional regulator, acetoin dehydrogenase operon transcriptional activator AcoR
MWDKERVEDRGGRDPLWKEIAKLRRLGGDETSDQFPEVVADSWTRCLADYHLQPDQVPAATVLDRSEMRTLTDTYEELLAIIGPEVDRLFERLVDNEFLVSFASPQGAFLLFRCGHKYLSDMAKCGVLPGSIWSEEQQGTNGVGTCLTLGKGVTIVGKQHYGMAIRSLTCITAPVRNSGVIEGVLNLTTARSGDDRTNRLVQDIVTRAARRVENRYFSHIHRRDVLMHLSQGAASGDLAEEGHLALDHAGRVIAVSPHVASLTRFPIDDLIGRSVDEVFDLDVPLSNIRPQRPIGLILRGKPFQGIITFPESQSLSRVAARPPTVAVVHALLGKSKLVEGDLHIDPMTSMALEKANRLLNASVPLLIWGESGTGKTTFARLAALRSFGSARDVIHVDCATFAGQSAISPVAQYGLLRDRACLLVDRLEELDDSGQRALLNLLENDFQPGLGQKGVVALAATDLDQMRKDGKLRPGLIHRLKGGSIVLPPLRHNPDLEGVIRGLLKIELAAIGKSGLALDDDARLVLLKYHWPGNLRELRNALRHAAILADETIIRLEHLPDDIVSEIARKDLTARSQSEASRIEAALRHNGGNVSLTARYLGISRATLYRKIQIQKTRGSAKSSSKD